MKLQNYEIKNQRIKEQFLRLKKRSTDIFKKRLNFSWSNWGFGVESFETSTRRLFKFGIKFIELHGNLYGKDLGYRPEKINKILKNYDIEVSGICGMFSADNDLSSNRPIVRQNAIDYINRNLEFGFKVGAKYFLIVPGAVGRPDPYDDMEFKRSVETLSLVADSFKDAGIRGAVEPIRSDEVSFCHTFKDAKEYIKTLGSPGVRHINGDVYHMIHMESHIGETIIDAEGMITNIHIADTNRGALGDGFLDLDTIIMALYIIGFNNDSKAFITSEPIGPGGDPYRAMYGKTNPQSLDNLVKKTVEYFMERENEVLSL